MGVLSSFLPFAPRGAADRTLKRPGFDVERALQVELHAHPSLEQHRAANGELVLVVTRRLLPAEKFWGRFFPLTQRRRCVLDKHGEFMLVQATKPGTTLAQVAARMAQEFDLDPDKARLGVIHLTRDLMLRGFVFLVRR